MLQDQKSIKITRRSLYFLLSFLAHIVIVIVLFLYKDDTRDKKLITFGQQPKLLQKEQAIFFDEPIRPLPENLKQALPKPEESEIPASLKPRQSNFGTMSYVDDPAQAEMPQQYPDEDLGLIERSEDVQEPPKPLMEAVVQAASAEAKVEPAEQIKTAPKEDSLLEQIQEIEKREQRFAELSEWASQHKEEDISILKKKPMQQAPSQQEAIASQPKQKANIIAMTKGYIENFTQEGNDWLKREGDDSKRPTLEEMKYFSYEQRISWQLQSCWKHNFERNIGEGLVNGKVTVAFTLDEKGNVVDLALLQSSGFKVLDAVVLRNVKMASPFPPLPKHFETKMYKTGRIIRVMADRFGV